MELTRREALVSAGAILASFAGACAPSQSRKRITGAILGASDERGHLLKSPPPVSGGAGEPVETLILGGGIAGLSAAWKLLKSNYTDFTILELENAPGGTAISGSNSICNYPWGAHYVPIPTSDQRALCELLKEMGVISGFDSSGRAVAREEMICRAPEERLFYKGQWIEGLYARAGATAEDLLQFERFEKQTRELAAMRGSDGRRIFTIPTAACSADPAFRALDEITMAGWLAQNNYNSPRLLWYVEYACRDDFGCYLSDVSAWAALHYFCSRLPTQESSPAEFLTWPEGNGFIVNYLSRLAGDRVRNGEMALSVKPAAGAVNVLIYNFNNRSTRTVAAKHVICATPQYVTRKICEAAAGSRANFHYAPWVVANLTLASRPAEQGFPLAWDNVLYNSESLGYVVATHQLDRLGSDSVWTWYRPFCNKDSIAARSDIYTKTWDHWRDEVIGDLRRAHHDIESHITNIDVYRWGHAMIRPEPGFLFCKDRALAAAPAGNIHFAGADLGGLPLFEEAQWAGVRAAEEVLSALGRTFTSSL